MTLAIAVYANVCKALGLPLSFPGKPGAYAALYQCTDAALLAKARNGRPCWCRRRYRSRKRRRRPGSPRPRLVRGQSDWRRVVDASHSESDPTSNSMRPGRLRPAGELVGRTYLFNICSDRASNLLWEAAQSRRGPEGDAASYRGQEARGEEGGQVRSFSRATEGWIARAACESCPKGNC